MRRRSRTAATGVQDALCVHFTIKVVKLQEARLLAFSPSNRDSDLAAIPACSCKSPASNLQARRVTGMLCCGTAACWQWPSTELGRRKRLRCRVGGRQLAARFASIAILHPVLLTATPAVVTPPAPKAAGKRGCEASGAGMQPRCTNGFTVDAVMGSMLQGAEAGGGHTAGASRGRSSSAADSMLGSCLHRLPSDPQRGTATTSPLGCFPVNNPLTSRQRNPRIPRMPDAALPSSTAR